MELFSVLTTKQSQYISHSNIKLKHLFKISRKRKKNYYPNS